jgi:hypothetical protein
MKAKNKATKRQGHSTVTMIQRQIASSEMTRNWVHQKERITTKNLKLESLTELNSHPSDQ